MQSLSNNVWFVFVGSEKNKDMQVVMGGLSQDTTEYTAQTLRVEEAIVHENYRETSSAVYNDIGDMFYLISNRAPSV